MRMRESERVQVRLPSGIDTHAVLARDGHREYLWLGSSEALGAHDRIRVDGEPVRVAQAASHRHGDRPTTVAQIRRLTAGSGTPRPAPRGSGPPA